MTLKGKQLKKEEEKNLNASDGPPIADPLEGSDESAGEQE